MDFTGPLKGIRFLDRTMWQFVPVSTAMMGDIGADAIQIESPDGDKRRGIAVNLETLEGREAVFEPVERCGVFLQNFRKGVAERLGMGYHTPREINPLLIHGSASGFGPDVYLPSLTAKHRPVSGVRRLSWVSTPRRS